MAIVGRADQISPGRIKAFEVHGIRVAVANLDGSFHAFGELCTHEDCSLADDGEVNGPELTCLCHFSVFDVNTGEVLDGPAREPLPIFRVVVVDGSLDVTV